MKIISIFQWIFFILIICVLNASGGRKIARACDGEEIQLVCDTNELIRVRSVFFGRLEKNYCIDHSSTDLSPYGDCNQAKEEVIFTLTSKRCDNRTICQFNATSRYFGGDCEKNVGYLEVVYDCKEIPPISLLRCEGRNMTMICPEGEEIEVMEAMYGRLLRNNECLQDGDIESNCFSPTALEITENACNTKMNCTLLASNTVFGNPCPYSRKYLSVTYRCRPILYRRDVVCEGDGDLVLQCPPGEFIVIENADYGRKNNRECSGGLSDRVNGTSCGTPLGTEIVRMRCDMRSSCSIKAENFVFGDPCPSLSKYMEVRYTCRKPIKRLVYVCSNQTFALKCPPDTTIEVTSAYYGRTRQGICWEQDIIDRVCYSPSGQTVVGDMCDGRNDCSTLVTSTFGGPCHKTASYLTAYYMCIKNKHLTTMACDGEDLLISCPDGYYIEVEEALFGRGDDDLFCPKGPMTDVITDCYVSVKSYVDNLCQFAKSCKVRSSSSLFGNPCGATPCYLEVKYTCHKWKATTKVACQGKEVQLACPENMRMRIKQTTYGRHDTNICKEQNMDNLSYCSSETALEIAKAKCDLVLNCTLSADEETFGDPCPNTSKYLTVTYECSQDP